MQWDGTEKHFWELAWQIPPIAEMLAAKAKRLPGHLAFKAYDTCGLPIEVTEEIMREKGWTVDVAEFERLMEQQRARSRKATMFTTKIMGDA